MRAGLRAVLENEEDCLIVREVARLADLPEWPGEAGVLVLADSEIKAFAALEQFLVDLPGQFSLLALSLDRGLPRRLSGWPLRAWGQLPPDCRAEELIAALRAVAAGLIVGPATLIQPTLTSRAPQPGEELEQFAEKLTDREQEVLDLLVQGLANKQIALGLQISEHTVKFHLSAIFGKLGVSNRTEAIRVGVQQGLVSL